MEPNMAKDIANAHAYGDLTNAIWTAPLGTTAPAGPLPLPVGAGWHELGWVDDGGVTETQGQQETKKYGWQGGSLLRILRSQSEHSFKFNCLEENAVVMGLLRPGSTTTTTGGTAEVQTVTLAGTGTAGTFDLNVPGYGAASAQPYNVTTTALASALSTAVGGTVTVTGTAGSSYIVTFPASLGNVGLMTTVNNVTGVTSITVAETTPGANAVNNTGVRPFTGRNLRQFIVDLVDGGIHKRYLIKNGEVAPGGNIVYKSNELNVYEFTLNCYVDADGNFFEDLNDNPALAAGLFS